jgi:hypothetical protein
MQPLSEEKKVEELERKDKINKKQEQEKLAEQERLQKMKEKMDLLKQSDNKLQSQAEKRLQHVGPRGFSTEAPSEEELVSEMEKIQKEEAERGVEAQKESESEFDKNLDLKTRKMNLGVFPETQSYPNSQSLLEQLTRIPKTAQDNYVEKSDSIAPFQRQESIPYAPEHLQSRKPAALEELPKIETPISTKQSALKNVEEQEIKAIKPEQPKEMSEVEKALQRVRQNRMAAAIQRSSANLGSAIASVGALQKISPDEESLKNLEEGIEIPVQELKFKQEQEKVQRDLSNSEKMADPNSDISIMTRNMLGQVGLSHLAKGNISAQDLKNAGIDVDSLLAKKIQMDQTAAIRQQAQESRMDARMSDMAARLAPKVQNAEYTRMMELKNQAELIRQASLNPNPQNDAAIIYGFIKTLDPDSAVKEGEIDFTRSARSYPTKLKEAIAKGVKGTLLSEEERKNILDFANRTAGLQKKAWEVSAAPYLRQAEKLGIPKDMITGVDTETLDKSQDTISKVPQGKIMIQRLSDGAKAPVDAIEAEKILRNDPDKFKRVE